MRIPCRWNYGKWREPDGGPSVRSGLLVGLDYHNNRAYAYIVKEDGEIVHMDAGNMRVNVNNCFSKTA